MTIKHIKSLMVGRKTLCYQITFGTNFFSPGREALDDHDCRHEEELLADVEHVLGCAGRHVVNHVLDCRQVALATVDL